MPKKPNDRKPTSEPKVDGRFVSVMLPTDVVELLHKACVINGDIDLMRAIVRLLSAIPWVAAMIAEQLPRDVYRQFLEGLKTSLDQTWELANAENPRAAVEQLVGISERPTVH